MLTKPFKPLALAFLVNLIISVEDKIKYYYSLLPQTDCKAPKTAYLIINLSILKTNVML